METHWHDILLHNDTGDAAFHKGAPLLTEALDIIAAVNTIPSATRLGLYLRDAERRRAFDPSGATFTEKNMGLAHAEHITAAAPLLSALRAFFQRSSGSAATKGNVQTTRRNGSGAAVMTAVPGLDGLLVPTSWAAAACAGSTSTFTGIDDPTVVAPSCADQPPDLLLHPLFSYECFLLRFNRLSTLMSTGEVFSACEPRVKVLQSRYSLYRAYNGGREDDMHPTFGGGDIKRAPKCDLRRLETCMSATSVVHFLEELRRSRPEYALHTEDTLEDGNMLSKLAGASRDVLSVSEALRRFFGSDVPTSEQVVTEEGLCLRPSYASDAADRWLSLDQLADAGGTQRARLATQLLRHVLSPNGGVRGEGELLAELLVSVLSRVLSNGSPADRLELEVTLTGRRRDELPRLARWCVRSGLMEKCPGVYFRLLIVQDAYHDAASADVDVSHLREEGAGKAKERSSKPAAPLCFGDLLSNIFEPIWEAYACVGDTGAPGTSGGTEKDSSVKDLQVMLARTTGFSVALTHAAAVQEMPTTGDPSLAFPLPAARRNASSRSPSTPLSAMAGLNTSSAGAATSTTTNDAASTAPPDAFFVYHIWRNMQLLNAFLFLASTHGSTARAAPFALTLHGGANSRTLFTESVLGLLLADAVVNPATVFEWSPFTYLYMLTQRHVLLTPSRNRCSSGNVKSTLDGAAITLAVQAGLHLSIATLDPLFYDTTNDALTEELMELMKQRGLANADVTEMCLHALEAAGMAGCYSWSEQRQLFGYAWPHASARYNQFAATQVSALRLHHRACARDHELDLLFSAVQDPSWQDKGKSATGVCGENERKAAILKESVTRAVLFIPARIDTSTDPSLSAVRSGASAYTLQREHDPALLNHLSSYHAHEARMHYPRAIITGPGTGGAAPSMVAKSLLHAMATRAAYQKFTVRADTQGGPPTSIKDIQKGRVEAEGNRNNVKLQWTDGVLDIVLSAAASDGATQLANTANGAVSSLSPTVPWQPLPTWSAFQGDSRQLRAIASADPLMAKYANKRLEMLQSKYRLHVALTNDDEEDFFVTVADGSDGDVPTVQSSSSTPLSPPARQRVVQPIRGDAHNCIKVDVHIHMASGVTAKSLLQFIRRKVQEHPDDVVGVDKTTGKPITLIQFFAEVLLGEQKKELTGGNRTGAGQLACKVDADGVAEKVAQLLSEMPIAALQVHAGKATFHRFDRFNHRFSPMGMSSLRALFLKTDNYMRGRYFAELIRGTFDQNAEDSFTFTENRLSLYGRSREEWTRLSRWFVQHRMAHRTNCWMIQVPRLFHLYRRAGQLKNFQEMLTNIFEPLWAATLHPEQHPYLHFFLAHVSGFDSVDNESDREPDQTIDVAPVQWTSTANPPFAYYMFHMWANLTTLNRCRAERGLNTFQFRPHAGESGDPDHMADVFFLADGIGHGINLDKRPVLQYLYYLAQIPLAVVPMSNNALFCRYEDHPLLRFLQRGLCVALGTDGPLIFHRTEQPLLEEYGTAEAIWNLSAADICELAAASVRVSGFPSSWKESWLGPLHALRSAAGNEVARTHVPQTRCAFRYEAYMEEVTYLQRRASSEMACRAMLTPLEEELVIMDAVGLSRDELLARRWSGPLMASKVKDVKVTEQQKSVERVMKTYDPSKV